MSVVEAARTTRAPMLTLAAVGVNWGGIAGLLPDIKAAVGASDAELGAALIAPAVGSMIALALAPRFGRALGNLALPLAGLGIALAVLTPLTASSPVTLAFALFFTGAAVALADMTALRPQGRLRPGGGAAGALGSGARGGAHRLGAG